MPGVHHHDLRHHRRQLRRPVAVVLPDLPEAHLVRFDPYHAVVDVKPVRLRDPRPHDHFLLGHPAVQIEVTGDVHVPQHALAHTDAADGVDERLALTDVAPRREVMELQDGIDEPELPLVRDHGGGRPLPVHARQGVEHDRLDPDLFAREETEELGTVVVPGDLELRDHVVPSVQPRSEREAPDVAGDRHGSGAAWHALDRSSGWLAQRVAGREEVPCHDEVLGFDGSVADAEADQEAAGTGGDEVGNLVGAGGFRVGAWTHGEDGDPWRSSERGGDGGGVLSLCVFGDDAEEAA
ncbi:hypothetical protein HU200_060090 [Digitaria exilis]|uniref:Uncharacterized protein n=1 Tax=Digitaria exilis TaxID=1010633 RepID=A0A835AK82_9POAL|nr:hypothetical protein HU200_060090 [Digitaria exilis]